MRFPHLTRFRDALRGGAAGRAYGPVILIDRRYREDCRLWLHEYEHVRQWYLTLALHPALYALSRRYRAWSEARAFARQVRDDRSDLHRMASRMADPVYGLRLSVAECRKMIAGHL